MLKLELVFTSLSLSLYSVQEDLVQMAFAGPDLEMDFEGLKDHAVDEELGINVKRNKILSQGM